jgi:hypothetical protein
MNWRCLRGSGKIFPLNPRSDAHNLAAAMEFAISAFEKTA